MPSGFSRTFSARAYNSSTVSTAKPAVARCCRRRTAEMVTATAPETIIARIPVAYAPACAFTSASKATVTPIAISV